MLVVGTGVKGYRKHLRLGRSGLLSGCGGQEWGLGKERARTFILGSKLLNLFFQLY